MVLATGGERVGHFGVFSHQIRPATVPPMQVRRGLLSVFADPDPGLAFRELVEPPEPGRTQRVRHVLAGPPAKAAREELGRWVAAGEPLGGLANFYSEHDGGKLCVIRTEESEEPLLSLLPIEQWEASSAAYRSGGELDWVVDLCSYRRARSLYRGEARWVVFGRIERGPGCLVAFLDGEHTGNIFFLAPEPNFNVARPVAVRFERLEQRIGKDLAAFLRSCGAHGPNGHRIDTYLVDVGSRAA